MPTVPRKQGLATTQPAQPVFQSGAAPARAFGPEPVGGEALGPLAQAAQNAAMGIQKNRNAALRTKDRSAARTQLRDLDIAERTTGSDYSDPERVTAVQQQMRAAVDQIIANHEGGEDSRAILSQALEQEVQTFMDNGAARGLAANQAAAESAIGETQAIYSNNVANDPASLSEQMVAMEEDVLQMYGDILTPTREKAVIDAGKAMMVTEAVNSMLSRPGGIDAAAKLLLDPQAIEVLSGKQRIELRNRVLETQREKLKANQKVGVLRSQLANVLGVAESEVPEGMLLQGLGVTSKTAEDVVKVVGPDGKPRYVKKSDAVGQEAVVSDGTTINLNEKGPSAFRTEMGKLDAERVKALNDGAQQSFRDLDEITRMKAALDSGRFQTGTLAFQRQMVSRLATFLGVNQDNEIWKMIGSASTADTLDAAMNRLAVGEAQKMSRITNMSLEFVKSSLPNLIRTPGGNRILVDVMEKGAQRQIDLANLANLYAREFDTMNPTDEQWAEKYPNLPRMSYIEAQADLERRQPVVDEEMRKRIQGEADAAPKSLQEAINNSLPPGLPKGSRFTGRVRPSDGAQLWEDPTGKPYIVKSNP